MKTIKLIILLFSLFVVSFIVPVYASDYHQDDQRHKVTYTLTDSTGQPVSGQSVGLALQRGRDEAYLDFSDNTFKSSGWTTRTVLMTYSSLDGFYWRVLSIDQSGIVSGEYVCIVSNDDATYGDTQAEAVEFDSLGKLVKIHR